MNNFCINFGNSFETTKQVKNQTYWLEKSPFHVPRSKSTQKTHLNSILGNI